MTTNEHDEERGGLPSASGIERLMMCPGSKFAEDNSPPQAESELADQGSKIHDARCKNSIEGLTDEEIQIKEKLDEIEAMAAFTWAKDKELDKGQAILRGREERFWIREPGTLRPLASAKLDWYYLAGDKALVVDDKTGFLAATPSPKNWQLRVQALAIYSNVPNVKEIRVAIAQYRFKARYDACDYSPADIEASMDELLHGLWKAEQMNQQRVPGYWCRYCRAKASCPEANSYALLPVAEAQRMGGPIGELSGAKLKEEIVRRVGLMSPKQIAFVYSRRNIIENVLEAAKDRLKAMPIFELAEIGLAMSPEVTTSSIGNLSGALDILFRQNLISTQEFTDCCTIALGKVLAVTSARMVTDKKATSKKEAEKYIRTILAGVMVSSTRQGSIIVLDPEPEKVEATEAQPTKPPVAVKKTKPAKKKKVKAKNAKATNIKGADPGVAGEVPATD